MKNKLTPKAYGIVKLTIIVVICLSCSQKDHLNENKTANQLINIDYSETDGQYSVHSIKIDSLGNFFLRSEFCFDSVGYFIGHLSDSVFQSLLLLIDTISKTNYDTSYSTNCIDCGGYQFILKTKSKKQKVLVHGYDDLKYLDSLSAILSSIAYSKKLTKIDSLIEFESYKYFTPPALKITRGFVPPSDLDVDYIKFGVYCGECGEHCATMYQLINKNGLYTLLMDTTDSYFKGDKVTCLTPINDKKKIKLALDIFEHIPSFLLETKNTSNRFGCPDCSDGCGIFLEINKDRKRKYFHIDYQTDMLQGEIAAFAEYFKIKFELISELK